VRPCLLLLLKEAPSYGYELLKRLPALGIDKDHATVYRSLRALEGEGLARSGWEERVKGPDRRRYEITEDGEAWLDLWATTVNETRSLLAFYLDRYRACSSDGPIPAGSGFVPGSHPSRSAQALSG
jgi:PadR family transcriptional regulator, regulatory protein PadR